MRAVIVAVSVLVSTYPAGQPGAPTDTWSRLDAALQADARNGFSGVVLVGRGPDVVFERAYGRAASLGIPPSQLAFWLASDSKQVTAVAILRLAEAGRLRVTDPISRFLPDAPADKRGITIHQLLTHTSGLPHAYAADGVDDVGAAVHRILTLKLKAAPGAAYSYSNDGYTLLAAIVQLTSGRPFDDYVQETLFTPLGLSYTGLWGHERADVTIAPPSTPRGATMPGPTIFLRGHSVANWGYRGPTGVYSSARDVFSWVRALQNGTALTPTSRQQLLGRHVLVRHDATGDSYAAYGWGVRVENGVAISYSHVGNEDWLGHNAVIRFTPAGAVVVVLSNGGDIDGSGWSSRANRTVRAVLDAQ